jgi:type III secretory pathway component EscS
MQPQYKAIVVAVFIGILVSLGSALYQLSRPTRDSKKMVRALAIRVGLSIALFLLLMILWYAGIISPHGLPTTSAP